MIDEQLLVAYRKIEYGKSDGYIRAYEEININYHKDGWPINGQFTRGFMPDSELAEITLK